MPCLALPALIYFVRVMKLGKRINLLMHKFDQTEGWFTLARLFAPLEPILDKTWRWNDIWVSEITLPKYARL